MWFPNLLLKTVVKYYIFSCPNAFTIQLPGMLSRNLGFKDLKSKERSMCTAYIMIYRKRVF